MNHILAVMKNARWTMEEYCTCDDGVQVGRKILWWKCRFKNIRYEIILCVIWRKSWQKINKIGWVYFILEFITYLYDNIFLSSSNTIESMSSFIESIYQYKGYLKTWIPEHISHLMRLHIISSILINSKKMYHL